MKNTRSVPDPSIGISDMMKPLETFMTVSDTRNLWVLLDRPAGVTWKTVPHPSWLAHMASLMCDFASVSPGLVFSSKKLKNCLEKLNNKEKINWTKKSDDDFFDWADESIRIACKQYRDLKNDPKINERAFKQVSAAEGAKLSAGLHIMQADKP